MAATLITSRPSAALVALAALLAVLALAAAPATASQLNFYGKEGCSGGILRACFDRSCCTVPSDAVSFRFYYNPFARAYLFNDAVCAAEANAIIENDIPCSGMVGFKSVLLTDKEPSLLKMATAQ